MNKIQRIPSENARGCFSLSSSSFDFRETSVGDLFRLSEMSSRSGGDFFLFASFAGIEKMFCKRKGVCGCFFKESHAAALAICGTECYCVSEQRRKDSLC